MSEHRLLTDEEAIAASQTGELPAGVALRDVALEVIRLRKTVRKDSRRAEQLRKLRWAVEGVHAKIEDLGNRERVETETAEQIAQWIEGYEDEPIDSKMAAFGIREGRWR